MPEPAVPERRAVVVGAGQAGLSAAHFLRRAGLEPGVSLEVLDANPTPGGAWSHRWDALTFDEAHSIHDLPGLPVGEVDPAEPAREVVKRYYAAYEAHEGLRVRRPARVRSVERADGADRLLVTADGPDGERVRILAEAVVSATGTWDRPFVPTYPGRFDGPTLTTRDFRAPEDFTGRRVLVVGGGASAVQFVLLLESAGAEPIWSTRREPAWTDERVAPEWGLAVEKRVREKIRAGLPPGSVVSNTGIPLTPRYRDGIARGVLRSRGPIARLTAHGVDFTDGSHEEVDAILWATGFRASLGHLAPLGLREPGGGLLVADDDVSLVREPRLFVVGYGPSASTLGATRAGRRAAAGVAALLAADDAAGADRDSDSRLTA